MSFDEDIFEDQEPIEESSELGLSESSFSDLLVAPADWTIGTLHSQIGKQIDLDPEFQRRNVWSRIAKSRFIESLMLGIPIPQILLSSKAGQKNVYLVLDGKQRLLALKEFLEDGFKLKDLRVIHELENKNWSHISQLPTWSDRLLNETQRTAVIRNWKSEEVLYEIFYRLNSGSVRLSPMELRMSLHPGPFLKFIIKWTENVGPIHELLRKKQPDPRMNDVELAVRFLGFKINKVTYNGDLKDFLDKTCIELNSEFDEDENAHSKILAELNNLNNAVSSGIHIFGEKHFCRKYIHGNYESRFNRAAFDVLVGALSNSDILEAAMAQPSAFEEAYIEASQDSRFINAIETTTKSVESTRNRFEIFYSKVSERFGIQAQIPNIRQAQ